MADVASFYARRGRDATQVHAASFVHCDLEHARIALGFGNFQHDTRGSMGKHQRDPLILYAVKAAKSSPVTRPRTVATSAFT